jgi:sugar phosphate isomerase/epimerase
MVEARSIGVVARALGKDLREAAGAARSAGFTGMQLDAFAPGLKLTELSETGRRELRHVLSGNDQQLVGLRVEVGPKGLGPGADVDRLLSQFVRVMEAAKGLEAPLVCADVGPLPQPPARTKPKPRITPQQAGMIIVPEPAPATAEFQGEPARPGPDPAVLASVDSALTELGSRADRVGVTVALRSELSSFAAIDRALSAARCPWLGVDLDPVAILRDSWSRDEIFSRLGPLIRHVRGRDATVGADRRTSPVPIGRGSTDWNELLAVLDDSGYHGWVTVDPLELPDRVAGAIAGARFLEETAKAR